MKKKLLHERDDESVAKSFNSGLHQFTSLKNKKLQNSLDKYIDSSKPSTSTPLFNRNGFQNLQRKSVLGCIRDSTRDQPNSPFSDSQWSDYGDETYIEAALMVQEVQTANQDTFDEFDSIEMSENSQLESDLTAACNILEASFAKKEEDQTKLENDNNRHTASFDRLNSSKGSNSFPGSSDIEEFDSFTLSLPKNGSKFFKSVTPKKQRIAPYPAVSPTRKMLTQLSFK